MSTLSKLMLAKLSGNYCPPPMVGTYPHTYPVEQIMYGVIRELMDAYEIGGVK